jgi:hypothetical protein
MWMTTGDRGLAAILYGSSQVTTVVGDAVPISIDSETNYPFEDRIRLKLRTEKPVEFPLYFRIPGWCGSAAVQVNGDRIAASVNERGFVKLEREWTDGDRLELRLPMEPRVETGRETPYPDTQIHGHHYFSRSLAKRKDIGEPFASIVYGPLLFALPLGEKSPNEPLPGAKWNYALNVAPQNASSQIDVVARPMPTHWEWQLADAPVELRVPALAFDWQTNASHPLPDVPVVDGDASTISLVPIGCTKFRISMFPVTEAMWRDSQMPGAAE